MASEYVYVTSKYSQYLVLILVFFSARGQARCFRPLEPLTGHEGLK